MSELKLGAHPLKICDDKYTLQLSKDKLQLVLALKDAEVFEPTDWKDVIATAMAAGVSDQLWSVGTILKMPLYPTFPG